MFDSWEDTAAAASPGPRDPEVVARDAGAASEVEEALAVLDAAIERLDDLDLEGQPDEALSGLVVGLHRRSARLVARRLSATHAWDARRVWAGDGARAAGAWLRTAGRLPSQVANGDLRLARKLPRMPATFEALAAGEITEVHARALERSCHRRTEDAFVEHEATLVGHASELRFDHFQRVLAYWRMHADPDGAEDHAKRRDEDRRAHLSTTFEGIEVLDAVFDTLGGAEFRAAFEAVERDLFEADWAETTERLGDTATLDDLPRSPAQRRCDALVEMARRAMTAPEDGKRPRPLVSVLMGYETFHGPVLETLNRRRVVLTPGQVADLLTRADLERIVYDGPSRVIDVGEKRSFTGATRRAIEIRDRECHHPYCTETLPDLDIDHITPWSNHGPTRTTNGRPACPYHNPGRRRPKHPRRHPPPRGP